MAAAAPLVAPLIGNVEKLGGTTSQYSTFPPPSSPSRRRTLKHQLHPQQSKENLHLLRDALHLLDRQSFDPDPQTYAVLLKSCVNADSLRAGQFIHEHISVNGYEHLTFLCNFLIEMYGKCGALNDARFLFDRLDQPNVFSWTILIAAYVHQGCFNEAYKLFSQMQLKGAEPNEFTFSTVLGTCTSHSGLAQGRYIHACIIVYGFDSNIVVGTALVNMYGKCRSAEDSGVVFHKMEHYDVVLWNAMITVLVEDGDQNAALILFHHMVNEGLELDKVTFASILGACVDQSCLEEGNMIHANAVGLGYLSELVVMNTLIDMYGKCGCQSSACVLFNKLQCRDVVSWTAIIVANGQHPREVLQLFQHMLLEGLMPNEFTYASVLTACASLKGLRIGQMAHHCLIEAGLEANVVVATALIRMYSRCVTVEEAVWVFDQAHVKDLVVWNAIIAMYAHHGLGKEALNLLKQMQQEGHTPDDITLTSVLSACGHAGLVDEGCAIYASMGRKYNITPSVEHGGCMVDLLGRAFLLQEAEDFIESMPLKPNTIIWEIFLNSCRFFSNNSSSKYAIKVGLELGGKSSPSA
ncbi:hypothetical protein GOP47_0014758 [Adiantum capillus-veneris]|uniref:Pentatricopeptide repeat-containing protein n=1 Tax=Adiantum capillus-veneris TaxID=13818 RepID=A0A9D4UMB8_ADICA|nr:hypothetical protein GOP47_0014758 [Adiantum capillus-veneris]